MGFGLIIETTSTARRLSEKHSPFSYFRLATAIRSGWLLLPLPVSRPPLPLSRSNPPPCGSTHPVTGTGNFTASTVVLGDVLSQCLLDLGNLGIDLCQLLLVARKGGGEE